MYFYRAFGAPKVRPGKHGQTQVDSRGVERIDRVVEFDTEVVVEIEAACGVYQGLGKVGVDTPVALFVGVGQGAAGHSAA